MKIRKYNTVETPIRFKSISFSKTDKYFLFTVFLSNLSHQRDRTIPYRTILYVIVFKKILSLHLPLLCTPLQGPSQ